MLALEQGYDSFGRLQRLYYPSGREVVAARPSVTQALSHSVQLFLSALRSNRDGSSRHGECVAIWTHEPKGTGEAAPLNLPRECLLARHDLGRRDRA